LWFMGPCLVNLSLTSNDILKWLPFAPHS